MEVFWSPESGLKPDRYVRPDFADQSGLKPDRYVRPGFADQVLLDTKNVNRARKIFLKQSSLTVVYHYPYHIILYQGPQFWIRIIKNFAISFPKAYFIWNIEKLLTY